MICMPWAGPVVLQTHGTNSVPWLPLSREDAMKHMDAMHKKTAISALFHFAHIRKFTNWDTEIAQRHRAQ